MQFHFSIDLRAVILGFVLLLVAAGIAAPFAISLADDVPTGETASAQAATAVGTLFTYQGQLNDGSGPANGTYDFQFRLFDDLSGTVPTAGTVPTIVARTATATDGLFTVDIDFGAAPFDGTLRFLEVRVKPNGGGSDFSVLQPLQPLTVVPQAIFATTAGSALTADTAQSATTAQTALVANSVQWANVANKPAGFADDLDNDTTYAPGSGLLLAGTQFSVQFLGAGSVSGNATSVARSDHTHFGQQWTGTGSGLRVTSTAGGIAIFGISSTSQGVYGSSTSYRGVHGISSSDIGVYGYSDTSTGVYGNSGSGYAGYFFGDVGIPANRDCYCSILPPSDLRLKRDVGSAPYGLAAALELLPRSYHWNEETDEEDIHLGFIAQEVQMIMPELVKESRDGMLALDYIGIIPVLTRAIQEQQAQIEELRTFPEPHPSGAPEAAPNADSPAPQVTFVRQSVGPSNAAIYVGSGAVALFALGLFAGAGAMIRRRPEGVA
jgi:hypothetical protein